MSGNCIIRNYPFVFVIDRFGENKACDSAYREDLRAWVDHFMPLDCISLWQPGIERYIGFYARSLSAGESSQFNLINPEPVLRVAWIGDFRLRTFAVRLCEEEPTPINDVERRYGWHHRNCLYADLCDIVREIEIEEPLKNTCGYALAKKWKALLATPPIRFNYEVIKDEDRYCFEYACEDENSLEDSLEDDD